MIVGTIYGCVAGATQVYSDPSSLERIMQSDFETLIEAVTNRDAIQAAREYKAKLDKLTMAYNPLIKDVIRAAENEGRQFSNIVSRDAGRAESSADEIYAWAKTFVPNSVRATATVSKQTKLKMMMPYVVAMAYAIRVKLDAHLAESNMMDDDDRDEFLERTCSTVEEFIAVVQAVTGMIIEDASLLEYALDYCLPLTTYFKVTDTMQRSVDSIMRAPEEEAAAAAEWDDGLSALRWWPVDRAEQ